MISNLVTSLRIILLPPLLFLLSGGDSRSRWWALGVFLLAGFADIIDGRLARRLGEVSRVGAMLDLIADRLLTLTVLAGLAAAGELRGVYGVSALILIARDLTVASFGEAVPGLEIKVTAAERVKITLQFLAFGLLIAPPFLLTAPSILGPSGGQYLIGRVALAASAALACLTVTGYARRAIAGLKSQ